MLVGLLGFRVKTQCLGFRVLGFGGSGSGTHIGFRVLGFGFRVPLGFRV